MFDNLHEVYPEAQNLWVLTNKVSDNPIEMVVTMEVLQDRFEPLELSKILNGTHEYWEAFQKF
ncbi:hypothetical protein ZPAH1_orf00215 [Aeromonas phage ZPAH1]|nr:hypothetical protein ASwh1_166 [Aeromonas phage Aswh_1]QQG33977.1 hypothetical protein ZPAH1_orf00215 [Aeromonas phage ZPAH1]